MLVRLLCVVLCAASLSGAAAANELSKTIALVKPAVVGIGSRILTRSPAVRFFGTGFAVNDGLDVITNSHVVQELLDSDKQETLGIVIARGDGFEFRPARLVSRDREHDLAHLRIEGGALPALTLADPATLAEGSELAFTGFPIGMALGLHHATHRALLAAVTPVVSPSMNSSKLVPQAIAQLQRSAFRIYQLDGTAYPGNSGSPLYDPASGQVVGVISMVLLKGLKESAISNPSGITYAVPVIHVRELLQRKAP